MVDERDAMILVPEESESASVPAESEAPGASGGIELLPHELLLMVLAHLGTRQLLQVRAVCRRWRDAALDPALWRPRELQWRYVGKATGDPLYAAVLRLAPCLRSLRVECQQARERYRTGNDLLVAMACSTRCAVEGLSVSFDSENAVSAAMTVRNQEGLGRLRTLFLYHQEYALIGRDGRDSACAGAGLLLDVACRAKGLAKLDFADMDMGEWSVKSLPTPDQPVPASLRELVDCAWVPVPLLRFLLRCHAPTLENVTLRHDLRNVEAVGELLSRVGNLVELRCGLMEDMTALLQCTKLRTLTLDVRESSPTVLREAKDFLRRAALLKEVTFVYFDDLEGACADLVGALAAPHHAAVEKVAFVLDWMTDSDDVQLLMTERFVRAFALTLPWLSALWEVRVDGEVSASFLEAVSPASAPDLRLLTVKLAVYSRISTTPCPHSFLHRADVRGVLERNPLLHVQVVSPHADCHYSDHDEPCEFCDRGECHSLLHDRFKDKDCKWRAVDYDVCVTLFSHPENVDCDVYHLRSDTDRNSFAFSLEAL